MLYFRIFSLSILSFILAACAKEDVLMTSHTIAMGPDPIGLTSHLDSLSSEDAEIVAKIYSRDGCSTKSSERTISSVIPVANADDEIVLYAVNFKEGGYLLVSATKQYYPILADVERGIFDPADSGNPASPVIEEIKQCITDIKKGNTCINSSSFWFKYQKRNFPEIVITKTGDDLMPNFYELLYEYYYDDWIDAGYNVYFLRNQPSDMPDDLYQTYCSIAQDGEDLESLGLDYRDTSIILEKVTDNNSVKGPLLSTTWHQISPWNDFVLNNYYLGCVTIATGQIMRYHQKPSSFHWSGMPDTYPNDTLKSFLADLRCLLHVRDDGRSSIDDARNVLRSFGYSCSIINHSASSVYSSIFNNYPVYMRGIDSTEGGHAWVCDGYSSLSSQTEYRLYLLETYMGYPDQLTLFDSTICNYWSHVSYHMNWGWAGQSDGYYDDPNVTTSGITYHFTSDRKDLLITP